MATQKAKLIGAGGDEGAGEGGVSITAQIVIDPCCQEKSSRPDAGCLVYPPAVLDFVAGKLSSS